METQTDTKIIRTFSQYLVILDGTWYYVKTRLEAEALIKARRIYEMVSKIL